MLKLELVNVSLGPAHILKDISLRVDSGEVVSLVGRNGAGKTTIIKSILGIVTVRSGKIIFKEKDITNLPPYKVARFGIGYSPEEAKVFSDLTVEENIEMAIWLSKGGKLKENEISEIKEKIYSVFPEIKHFLKRRGLYLSGGEKKIVSVARALALNPSLLLLDEAFEGLAPVVRLRFIEALKKIKELGISVLIAESNVRVASEVADRLYAIDRGEIIYEGKTGKIFENKKIMRIIYGY